MPCKSPDDILERFGLCFDERTGLLLCTRCNNRVMTKEFRRHIREEHGQTMEGSEGRRIMNRGFAEESVYLMNGPHKELLDRVEFLPVTLGYRCGECYFCSVNKVNFKRHLAKEGHEGDMEQVELQYVPVKGNCRRWYGVRPVESGQVRAQSVEDDSMEEAMARAFEDDSMEEAMARAFEDDTEDVEGWSGPAEAMKDVGGQSGSAAEALLAIKTTMA